MMIRVIILLLACACLSVSGSKLPKSVTTKKLKKIKAELAALESLISKLETDTALIEECLQTSTDDPNWGNVCVAPPEETADRSDKDTAADVIWAASMYQSAGETCSPQQLSNCVRTLDTYYATGGSTLVTNTYTTAISSCQMTAPVNGYYNVCVHARFKKGGNSGDVTIGLGGTIAAAFGDAVGDDWRSTGTCIIKLLTAGSTINAQFHSGGGDCIEETSWRYGVLSAYLVVST